MGLGNTGKPTKKAQNTEKKAPNATAVTGEDEKRLV
jgi:hypothetical protein